MRCTLAIWYRCCYTASLDRYKAIIKLILLNVLYLTDTQYSCGVVSSDKAAERLALFQSVFGDSDCDNR